MSAASLTAAENLRGSLWMIAAMAGFAVEDLLLKQVSRTMPVGEILILFGVAGALIFAALARFRGDRVLRREILSRPILFRAGFEVTGRIFYTLALAWTPLAFASAIMQATPLVVVAGAALIFGERVGWRRWSAIMAGFAGVMMILRPGAKVFPRCRCLPSRGCSALPGATWRPARPLRGCRTSRSGSMALR